MRIVYATDGSEPALAGAFFLGRLGLGRDSEIRVVSVAGHGDAPEARFPALDAACGALASATASGARLTRVILHGEPAEEILRDAEGSGADLIVVGTQGLSGIQRLLLGSVAERVVRHARTPVLVTRPLRNGLASAVIGLDASAGADQALRFAASLPLPPECRLHIVTVVLPAAAVAAAGHIPLAPRLQDEAWAQLSRERTEARTRLGCAATYLRSFGREVTATARPGDAADGLIAAAEEASADLIAVGAHGMSAAERFLIGSVAEKVARYAPCSVLCVREAPAARLAASPASGAPERHATPDGA